ncbi:MAG TPA: hypothetical protein VG934_00395 [Candidatus Paceibacterota bacterium]|nr:hypothetical protein [Candidatus Paceibacterota bacterium]
MTQQDTWVAQPIISGMWKFSDSVPLYQLQATARAWSMGVNGENYTDIHIRQCSKDQHGIGFKYVIPGAGSDPRFVEREYKKFFHKMTDQLKRSFGNDFVGWDVSPCTWVIK